jgi:hypothetical protein
LETKPKRFGIGIKFLLLNKDFFDFVQNQLSWAKYKGSPSIRQIRERTRSFFVSFLLDIGTFVQRFVERLLLYCFDTTSPAAEFIVIASASRYRAKHLENSSTSRLLFYSPVTALFLYLPPFYTNLMCHCHCSEDYNSEDPGGSTRPGEVIAVVRYKSEQFNFMTIDNCT